MNRLNAAQVCGVTGPCSGEIQPVEDWKEDKIELMVGPVSATQWAVALDLSLSNRDLRRVWRLS